MKMRSLLCSTGVLLLSAIAGCDSTVKADTETAQHIGDVTVEDVVDGDTIRATVDGKSERIRLLGIDTPELGRDGDPGERCACEATQFLNGWLPGSTVTPSTDPGSPDRDRFDRLLTYVEIDGVDVSRTMLAEGWADLYTGNMELTRWSEYEQVAENSSKQECIEPDM